VTTAQPSGRHTSDGQQDPFGQDALSQIGFQGVPYNPAVAGGIVGVDIAGHIRLGSPNFMPKYQHTDQVQYLNTLSWLRGSHQVKFGADVMTPMNNEYVDIPSTRGNLGFTNQFTGNAIADFMLGGYGMFFNPLDRIGSEDQLALNPPGLINNNQQTNSTTAPVFLLRDGFPSNYLDPANIVLSRLLIRAANPNGDNATVQQFAAGVERQIGSDLAVSADFIGNFGRQIAVLRNLNQPANGNGERPYPNFAHIQWRDPIGESQYYGVDVSAEKRYGRGYSWRMAYTISEARDQAPEHLAATSGRQQDTNDLQAWEGPSDFDVRHRFVGNFVAEIPVGAGRAWDAGTVGNAILGDWTASGIYTARTGRPCTVTQGSLEGATWMPNLVGDPEGAAEVDNHFNVAAFQPVPAGTFGNAGRNILFGPGFVTFDLSLQKRVNFTDRVSTSFRWDVFNLFNRANFGNPNSNITGSTVGTITTLAGDPRVMQFSVRLFF
jgi:hypothetical protein